jgi:hypothetical protein
MGWLTMTDERIVTVYLLVDFGDGVKHIGNSYECFVSEAVALIRRDEAKDLHTPRGVVPDEWLGVGVAGNGVAVAAEAEDEHGSS